MTGIDSNLGAKIVQNIEIMEGATAYVDGPILTMLSKEVARIFGSKQKQFEWALLQNSPFEVSSPYPANLMPRA